LQKIEEPFGPFTSWLSGLLEYFENVSYDQDKLNFFCSIIEQQLNLVFIHVIDNSYDTIFSAQELKAIHDGEDQ
jgi:hypothetical protein